MIYTNKIEDRMTFEIKPGYYLEILMPETMKLLGSTKSKINKSKNGENILHLQITEIELIHCDNNYKQDSRVLYTLIPNKSFAQLLDISQKNSHFSKTSNWEYSYIEVWFIDQSSKPLEIK